MPSSSKKNGKNIIYFILFGSLIVGFIIFMCMRKNDNYDSGEHTIASDGCDNLKRDFSTKTTVLDKCGDLNSRCIDPLSLKKLCDPTVSNIYLLHDSKEIDRSVNTIWAITNVLVISEDEWYAKLANYKNDGWVACGKNQGTIPGIQADPLDTNIETGTASAFLCVQYKKVNINSTTPILTSIKAEHFTFGKSTCSGREVKTVGKISKNLIAGPDSIFTTSPCYAVGGCTRYEPVNTCTKYIQSIILNYAKSPELNRYAVQRNIEPGSSYTGIILSFPSSKMKAIDWKYKTANPNSPLLSFGDILALAGDFYGIPEEPITPLGAAPNLQDEKRRFMNCFNTLKNNQGEELTKIMEIFSENMQKINDYLIYGKLVSDYYHSLGHKDDIEYNKITGGGSDKIPSVFNDTEPGMVFKGRYLNLAQNNYDHFCEKNHAYRAYMAGHTIAMETAAFAKSSGDDSLLHMAYAYEAFACHFLSDHFSSGHIRVPREDLHKGRNCSWWNTEFIWTEMLGDYCSKLMHDEDNRMGLMVANNACYMENPDPSICKVWRAYGDAYMTDPQNQENLKRQQEVLQIAVDEVWNSYTNGSPVNSKVSLYLPCIDERAKIPKLDSEGRIVGYYPNNDIYNDTLGRTPVKIGECSSLNHTPMFLAPDPKIYGKEYNCIYKRVGDNKMTYVVSPGMAIIDFAAPGASYFPGVTHGE